MSKLTPEKYDLIASEILSADQQRMKRIDARLREMLKNGECTPADYIRLTNCRKLNREKQKKPEA